MVILGMETSFVTTSVFYGTIIVILMIGFGVIWDKFRGLHDAIKRLEGFLHTTTEKVEHLEQELFKKKVIDSYHKSPEELRKEQIDRELDKELEDMLKKNEEEQENLLGKMDKILEREDEKNNK